MSAEDEREWQTRKQRISPVLDALGRPKKARPSTGPHRLEEYETTEGPADFACREAPFSIEDYAEKGPVQV